MSDERASGNGKVAPHPFTTRQALLARIAERTGNRRNVAPVVDAVLAEVRQLAFEHFGNDWNGEQFLRVLDGWGQTERHVK